MEIIIHLDLPKIETDYLSAINEYIKRTSPFCKITIQKYKNKRKINLSSNSKKYLLQPGKQTISSTELADSINQTNIAGFSCIEYIITSPDSEIYNYTISNVSNLNILSICSFNLNNSLNTVVLTEQIYRAYTILNNIKYHK